MTKGGSPLLGWGYSDLSIYAERIGGLEGIEPICSSGMIPENDLPVSIRCYHDSTRSIKMVSEACDKGISLGVANTPFFSTELSIYPNPASGKVILSNTNTANKIKRAGLCTLDGRSLQVLFPAEDNSIDTRNIPNGLYLLQLTSTGGESFYLKLVIVH